MPFIQCTALVALEGCGVTADFMTTLAGASTKQQCDDHANTVAIVARSLGVAAERLRIYGPGFTKPLPSVMVLVGYGVAFFFLSLTLERIPVGVGYAIWSGAGVTLIAAIGWLWFGEKLDPAAILGIALIVVGVVVLNVFSKTAAH
jgi:small multidrug resistance pump